MQFKYYAAALFSFIVWGCFSLVLRPLSDYAAMDIMTYRVGFAAILICSFSLLFRWRVTRQNILLFQSLTKIIRLKTLLHALGSAVALAFNWYLYIYVMNNVSVKATSLAYLICPILTTVLATIILKEKLNRVQWIAVSLSILSCVLLSLGHFMDMFYSIIIAFSYAIYLVFQKMNTRFDKFFTLTIHIMLCALMLIPYGYSTVIGLDHSITFYQLVLVIAVFFTIIPLFLNMYALKGLSSSLLGILLYINPIIAFLLAVYYFGESVSTMQAIAYGIIFFAVVVFNWAYFTKTSVY